MINEIFIVFFLITGLCHVLCHGPGLSPDPGTRSQSRTKPGPGLGSGQNFWSRHTVLPSCRPCLCALSQPAVLPPLTAGWHHESAAAQELPKNWTNHNPHIKVSDIAKFGKWGVGEVSHEHSQGFLPLITRRELSSQRLRKHCSPVAAGVWAAVAGPRPTGPLAWGWPARTAYLPAHLQVSVLETSSDLLSLQDYQKPIDPWHSVKLASCRCLPGCTVFILSTFPGY